MWKRKAAKLREEYEKENPDKGKKNRKRAKAESKSRPKQVEAKKSGVEKAPKREIIDSEELIEKVMSIIKKRTSEEKVEKGKKVKKVEEDNFIEE